MTHIRKYELYVLSPGELHAWLLCIIVISMTGITASQFVRTLGCFLSQILLKICNRITTISDIILTTGGGIESLNERNSSKAAKYSDELTCLNARHGTATPDNNTAKQPCNSQGLRTISSDVSLVCFEKLYSRSSIDVVNPK